MKKVKFIAPVNVVLPFTTLEFSEAWNIYKEYQIRTHNNLIPSRQEVIMLQRINRFSSNNEQIALFLLNYYIQNKYKCIFYPKINLNLN
jgi:hypothetical protein